MWSTVSSQEASLFKKNRIYKKIKKGCRFHEWKFRKWQFCFFCKAHQPAGSSFQHAKYYPRGFFLDSMFFHGWTAGAACHILYKHWGKNPKIACHRKQSLNWGRHFKTRLTSWTDWNVVPVLLSEAGNLYTDFCQQCLYKKDTPASRCTALEKYTLSKRKKFLGYKIFCRW